MQKIKSNALLLRFNLHSEGKWSIFRTFAASAEEKKNESEFPANFVDECTEESITQPKISFNKSGLLPQHQRMLKNEVPYDSAHSWIHNTERYQRKLYGRYGSASNVSPRICFPNKTELAELQSIPPERKLSEMMASVKAANDAKNTMIKKREDDIAKKLEKLDQWKAELNAKIAKKEADANAARERKERLVEEVRRHFGFTIDPRDERFKELLEQKEKEDRKKQKEAKRKAKEEKVMAKLVETVAKKEAAQN